jgi:hypothetical protein
VFQCNACRKARSVAIPKRPSSTICRERAALWALLAEDALPEARGGFLSLQEMWLGIAQISDPAHIEQLRLEQLGLQQPLENESTKDRPTFRLAGSTRTCPCHACAFFDSKEEEYGVLLPFMKEGYDAGDKLINIIDKGDREERLRSLARGGLDIAAAERTGQLELRPWEQAHLSGGHFDQNAMLASLEQVLVRGDPDGGRIRIWSNQEWALDDIRGVDDIVEYECRFNYIWPKSNDMIVCVYDTTKFGADVLLQILRTHPFAIVGNALRENSFYVPPDELLKELGKDAPRQAE